MPRVAGRARSGSLFADLFPSMPQKMYYQGIFSAGLSMTQDVVWATSIALMGALAAVFAWVAAGADLRLANYGPMIASAYRLRGWLFLAAVAVLVAANWRTLAELPYANLMPRPDGAVVTATATGEQWAWTIKPDSFTVGQTVEFHVTSKDVNHGFALYSPDMRIVAQVQAMPSYVNTLRYTFTEPGTYHVLCLEYCGLNHHNMKIDIAVAPAQ
jgi:cytochrome c oxidase subunit II